MKKVIISIFTLLACALSFMAPQVARAQIQDYDSLPIVATISGGNVVEGYLNSSNESVTLIASPILIDEYLMDESGVTLSINDLLVPLVPVIENGLINYTLNSNLRNIFANPENRIAITANLDPIDATLDDLSEQATSNEIVENFSLLLNADFTSPTANVNSPKNGAIYNKDVVLDFDVQDLSANAIIGENTSKVYLDGELTSLKSGDTIKASQGKHTIRIVASDVAGNQTTVNCEYVFDSLIYFNGETYFDGSIFYIGDKIYIRGWTEPGSKVSVRLTDYDPEAIANQDGYFEIIIDSSDVGVGDYGAFVDITDPAGNSYSWGIGHLTIKKIKLARSTAIMKDVVSKASEGEPVDIKIDENLAQKPIQIKAISDQKGVSTNWSAWIILLFAVVLASGISTAGYYGYEWIFGGSNAIVNEHATQKPVITKRDNQENSQKKDESREDGDHSLRW